MLAAFRFPIKALLCYLFCIAHCLAITVSSHELSSECREGGGRGRGMYLFHVYHKYAVHCTGLYGSLVG